MNKATGYTPTAPDLALINSFISAAFAEDVHDGDHTSLSTIPENAIDKAKLLVKDNGVLAGVDLRGLFLISWIRK